MVLHEAGAVCRLLSSGKLRFVVW